MAFKDDTLWIDEVKYNGEIFKKGFKYNGESFNRIKFNDTIKELRHIKWATATGITRTNKYDSTKEADILSFNSGAGTWYHTLSDIHGVTELIPCLVRDSNVYELEWGDKTVKRDDQWVKDKSGNLFVKWQLDNKLYWQNNTGNSYTFGILLKERDKATRDIEKPEIEKESK